MSEAYLDEDQKIEPYPPDNISTSSNARMSQTLNPNQYTHDSQPKNEIKPLGCTLPPRNSVYFRILQEKNKNSPYLQPVDGFGNYPPPPLLRKSKTNPSLIQPIRPAKICPPTTPRSPRKYSRPEQEGIPYSVRAEWKTQSEINFFNQVNLKHQQERQYTRIYSNDLLRHRQLSIERVSAARKRKEMEDRKQRIQECKDHQKSVRIDQKHDRFYNDEIYCRTGRQYRYIPNHDRCNPSNDDYIHI